MVVGFVNAGMMTLSQAITLDINKFEEVKKLKH